MKAKIKVTKAAGLRRYKEILKDAKKYFDLAQNEKPKKERLKFEETQDYKVIKKRMKRAEYYYNNRNKIIEKNKDYRERKLEKIREVVETNYTTIAQGPAFEVLAYNEKAVAAVMFVRADKLGTQPNFRGIIHVQGEGKKTYTTKDGYFDGIRDVFDLLRTLDSSAYCVIQEYTDAEYYIQKVEITLSDNENDDEEYDDF